METKKQEDFIFEDEYTEMGEKHIPKFTGMGAGEVKSLQPIMQRFMTSYVQKSDDVDTEAWLAHQLTLELPEKSANAIEQISREIIENINEFDQNLTSINEACNQGQTKEEWFQDKVQTASIGVSVNNYGNYLANIDRSLYEANAQMMRAVSTQSGEISQCFNLDGFIAEQHHVNSFNAKAALENQSYRAEVLAPELGETYGLNSFDVVIKNIKSGKILHQYQFKYGQDAKATMQLLKHGVYNNQRFVVPAEQVAKIQEAFPGKSVSDTIGGTDKVSTVSEPMTKAQAKEYQNKVQAKHQINELEWNNYSTKDMAIHLGKNAALAGLGGAALSTGFHLAVKAIKGESINREEAIEVALTSGVDAGVKTAAAGALKVGVEKGLVPLLAKGTPAGIIANIACLGIENAKIMAKFAKGEISGIQALDYMARTSVSTVYGLGWGATGSAIGAAACAFIPVVGSVVGGVVGGMVGYIAGSKFGSIIYNGVKKIAKVAHSVAETAWDSVKYTAGKICSSAKSTIKTIASLFGF